MKKYQVYRIDDMETSHYYIGMHRGDIFDDDYWGSGSGIKEHMKLNGRDGLDRSVLQEFANEESCATMEAELVTWDTVNDPMCLNRQPGGWYNGSPSENTRKKMSESLMGNKRRVGVLVDQETREKISASLVGIRRSEGTKRRISESNRGRQFSEEHKRSLSEANRGRDVSSETRSKIREARLGRGYTEESVSKRSGKNHYSYGVKGPSHPLFGKKPRRILTEKDVIGIRASLKSGTESYREIGDRYGVSLSAIYQINKGLTWRHVGV